MKNANRGYIGYSISVRANQSYNDGFLPKTKFKSHYGISERMFNEMVDRDLLSTEWHHTSKMFNKTNFYKPNEEGMVYLAIKHKLSEAKRAEVIMSRMLNRMNEVKHVVKPISFEEGNGFSWVVIQDGVDINKAERAVKFKYGQNATISKSGNPTHYHIKIN